MAYISFDPWRQKINAAFPEMSDESLSLTVGETQEAFSFWRDTSPEARSSHLAKLRDRLTASRHEVAVLMAKEMGKPVTQGLAEADKCALLCDYYAKNAASMLKPEKRASSARESFVHYEPQGIILGIMPWNFPFWQVFRFMVPALAGGNAALLKHASGVPQCSVAIERLVSEAGFPAGIFHNLFASHDQIIKLIADPRIRGVSLTGSNSAGKEICAVCGRHLKKVVMELGGSDPFIVFPDADLDRAVEAAVYSRFQNGGQSCIAAKRIIIHRDIYELFRERFVERTLRIRIGDPLDSATEMGPMASAAAVAQLDRQVGESVKAGARLLCGGVAGGKHPALFMPAVVENVTLSSPLACEEVFGPVAPLFRFTTVDEVTEMANRTLFGLGASIWTSDRDLAMRVARKIDSGTVAINGFVRSEPALPFGGVKESGFGRELGPEGLREFLNVKTVSFF